MKKALKWAAIVVASLIALIIVAGVGLGIASN